MNIFSEIGLAENYNYIINGNDQIVDKDNQNKIRL